MIEEFPFRFPAFRILFCRPKNLGLALTLFNSMQCDKEKLVIIFLFEKFSENGTWTNEVIDSSRIWHQNLMEVGFISSKKFSQTFIVTKQITDPGNRSSQMQSSLYFGGNDWSRKKLVLFSFLRLFVVLKRIIEGSVWFICKSVVYRRRLVKWATFYQENFVLRSYCIR